MTKQDILNYVMETPENINPAILGHFIDEVSEGSGNGNGGSNNDFTIATMTIIQDSFSQGNQSYDLGFYTSLITTIIYDEETGQEILDMNGINVEGTSINLPKTDTFKVVLYKGQQSISLSGDILNTEGNIAFNETTEMYDITGDCTIHYNLLTGQQMT